MCVCVCVCVELLLPPRWFSLKNSKMVKAVPWYFAAFSNISLETFVPNLVSITRPSPQVSGKTQTGVFLIKENRCNSRTSDDIDMELRPLTKLDTRNKIRSKNWRWHHVGKLWRRCHFFDLWRSWSNLEVGFRMQSL